MDWWRTFFDDDYRRLWAPVLGVERTEWELDGLLEILSAVPVGASILDVCGGDGRVARPLAARGYNVVVADASRSMLEHGQSAPGGERVSFVAADARTLPFAPTHQVDGRFDVALNLFTSFGLFETDGEHVQMLRSIARSLRPGGMFVMDLVHRDTATLMPTRTWFELADGGAVLRSFEFDPIAGRTRESLRALGINGEETHKKWSLRVFTGTEIDRMLRAAGFEPQAWYGGYELEGFSTESSRLLVVARIPETGVGARDETRGDEMGVQPTEWRSVVERLACPETGQSLSVLDEGAVQTLNSAIADGRVARVDGKDVAHGVDSALLRADGAVVYPVRNDIPELFPGEAFVVSALFEA